MVIDYLNLRKLDLNLLLALDVLVEQVNVTKAAEKLDMSQSAMSYALKRLRILLDDPILIRSSREMEATPYARELSVAVRQILTEIQSNILEKKPFDPDIVSGDFRIAFSDYVEATLGKNLLTRLAKLAPGIHIRVDNLNRTDMLDALDGGRIDLLVDASAHHKNWHLKQELYQEEFVCVVDKDVSFSEMTVERYLEGRHILASMQDSVLALLDKTMAQPKVSRNIAWSTPHLMAIPFLVTNSACIALLPSRLAQKYAILLGLKILPSPPDLTDFTVSMFWHQRNDNIAQHQWLRSQLVEAAQALQ